jgi:hypothetical protein
VAEQNLKILQVAPADPAMKGVLKTYQFLMLTVRA